MKIKFSIIVPSLNNKKFLLNCLNSIFNQTYKNYEIIVVDGGSTDGTLNILKKYKKKLKNNIGKDKGQYDAINKGILVSSGNWITWQNCDDYYSDKNALKEFAKYIKNYPNKKLFVANINLVNSKKKILIDIKYIKPNFYSLLYEDMTLTNQACFWKKDLHKKIGYLKNMRINFDYEWFLRVLFNFNSCGQNINKILACYRIHNKQKTQNQTHSDINNKLKIKKKYGHKKIYLPFVMLYLYIRKILIYISYGEILYVLRGIFKFF